MLKLEHVIKHYPSFTLSCSLNLRPGMISGIVGLNGAGKTTLFKAILALISIDEGKITLFNQNHCALKSGDKENIGVVIADSFLSEYLTINDYIPMLKAMYKQFDENFFLKQIHTFNLSLDQKIKDMSTGMRAKLKVVVALSHQAQLIILDEPTSGLDVVARQQILDLLRDYMAEDEMRSILISSHISSDLESICDDLYMMDDGQIVLHEDCDVLLSNYGLLKLNDEQFEQCDSEYFLKVIKESYGYCILTNQKQYYVDNYPSIVIENSSIDEIIMMMLRGNDNERSID